MICVICDMCDVHYITWNKIKSVACCRWIVIFCSREVLGRVLFCCKVM